MDLSTILAIAGVIVAILIPVMGFGWKMLILLSQVDNSNKNIASTMKEISDNMNENDVTHAEIVARLKVFEVKIEADLKAIQVRLDTIEERLAR